jgi:hypothetical protein
MASRTACQKAVTLGALAGLGEATGDGDGDGDGEALALVDGLATRVAGATLGLAIGLATMEGDGDPVAASGDDDADDVQPTTATSMAATTGRFRRT